MYPLVTFTCAPFDTCSIWLSHSESLMVPVSSFRVASATFACPPVRRETSLEGDISIISPSASTVLIPSRRSLMFILVQSRPTRQREIFILIGAASRSLPVGNRQGGRRSIQGFKVLPEGSDCIASWRGRHRSTGPRRLGASGGGLPGHAWLHEAPLPEEQDHQRRPQRRRRQGSHPRGPSADWRDRDRSVGGLGVLRR